MVRTKADSVPASYRKGTVPLHRCLWPILAANLPVSFLYFKFAAKNKYAGGNPVCPRPTPTWQKGIGDFFGGPPRKPEKENQRPNEVEDDEEAGGSGMSKASKNNGLMDVMCRSRPLPAEEEEDD
uniref:PCNA-associated factor n=1 Tax=Echeneis naucrates TaxID=173247 RepID=A0A665VN57_ECHNA